MRPLPGLAIYDDAGNVWNITDLTENFKADEPALDVANVGKVFFVDVNVDGTDPGDDFDGQQGKLATCAVCDGTPGDWTFRAVGGVPPNAVPVAGDEFLTGRNNHVMVNEVGGAAALGVGGVHGPAVLVASDEVTAEQDA